MAYIGVSPSNGVRRVHTYTATASQTTFTGAGAEGATLSYKDSNYVDVYQNGVKLGDADYTATSGTSIVLGTGATASDLVVVVVFDVFSVADTVSKADGGTFDGNVTMAGTLGVTGNQTNTGNLTVNGAFTSQGIDDNADATAITIDSSEHIGIGGSPNNFGGMTRSVEIKGASDVELSLHATSDSMSDGARIGQIVFNAGSDSTVPTVSAIKGSVSGTDENKGILTFHTRNTDTGGLPDERMRINNSGDVMVGTTTVDLSSVTSGNGTTITSSGQVVMAHEGNNMFFMNLTDYDGGTENYFVFLSDGSTKGSIGFNGSATVYATSSDHRLKENVTADWDATTRLKQLNPVRFNFIDNADTTVDGFLAHEVQTIVPEAITGTHNEVDDDDNPVYQGIDQSKLVPLLVKTIQELEARITTLENAE